jgi:hypothetical protein
LQGFRPVLSPGELDQWGAGGHRWQQVPSGSFAAQAPERGEAQASTSEAGKHIAQYLAQLDEGDAQDAQETIDRAAVKQALRQLQDRHADNLTVQALMEAQGLEQFVEGEADAKKMRCSGKSPCVAYNVQSAVDAEHGLIVHHEVTSDCTDNQQLEPMAKATQAVLQQPELTVTADAGYSNGAQFQACEEAGITAFVPVNRAPNNQGGGTLFVRQDFTYDPATDSFQCPAGKTLSLKQLNRGTRLYAARAEDCGNCPLKSQVHTGPTASYQPPSQRRGVRADGETTRNSP